MIRNILKYLVVFLSAAYFLFAGTGYNVVSYCCKSCAERGIEAVATSSCSAIHHHNHDKRSASDDIACSDLSHHPDGCHFWRVKLDTPSVQASIVSEQPLLICIDIFEHSPLLLSDSNGLVCFHSVSPHAPPLITTGRMILTAHSVLLI